MEKYLPILRSCPFFMGLNDTEILSILHCVNAVKVSKASRSYIFKAGDSTEVMGLVLAGSTLIIQEDLWGHLQPHFKAMREIFRRTICRNPGHSIKYQCCR